MNQYTHTRIDHICHSHGKGPWDGLGAVVKTLLRRMEKYPKFPGHIYCTTQADCWLFLSRHYSKLAAVTADLKDRVGRVIKSVGAKVYVDVGVGVVDEIEVDRRGPLVV